MLDPVFSLTLALLLTTLLWHAAFGKLGARAEFRAVLDAYDLLPPALNLVLSLLLPVTEGLSGLALLVGRTRPLGGLAASALFAVYGTAIAVNLARGRRDLDCGCAGPGARRPITGYLVWRNAGLSLAGLALAAGTAPRLLTLGDGATVLGAVLGFALLYLTLDRLYTHRPAGHGVDHP